MGMLSATGPWAFAQERDPFVSSLDLEKLRSKIQLAQKMDSSQLILRGIIWNEKLSVAIINDELFVVGDECKGLKIKGIEKDAVIMTDGVDSSKLSIPGDVVPARRTQLAQNGAEVPSQEIGVQKETVGQQQRFIPQERQRVYPQTGFRLPSQPQQGRTSADLYNSLKKKNEK